MNGDWRIFTGDAQGRQGAQAPPKLPAPPPWRRFAHDGGTASRVPFETTPEMVEAVNAALHLRRPLMLTGRPGSGKSSLIDAVAAELGLGRVIRWHITSRSTVTDGCYRYDAIGRLHMKSLSEGSAPQIEDYLRLGPLGTAMAPGDAPRALLIDEIDKGDMDLPNDLLNIFERGEFEVPELARLKDRQPRSIAGHEGDGPYEVVDGWVRCSQFPFVVLTSNGEREFPAAFLRRCIRLRMPDPSPELLARIVRAHFPKQTDEELQPDKELIDDFSKRAQTDKGYATDQLLNAIFILSGEGAPTGKERDRLKELIFKRLATDTA